MTTTANKTEKVRDGFEKAFYASVGAPVHAAKKYVEFVKSTGETLKGKGEGLKEKGDSLKDVDLRAKLGELRTKATDELKTRFETWTAEGEELISGLKDQKVVEDLSGRVNLEQLQEQAGKLRGQLEDLVTNWRTNFAPEETAEKVTEGVKKAAGKVSETVKKAESKVTGAVKEISEKVTPDEDLTVINGIGPAYALRLKEANIDTFAKLAKTPVADLAEAAKVRTEMASKWIAAAKKL